MGVVYRAVDVKLGRSVALKVLPPELTADPARRRRLEQEARAACAISHPNIAHVYEAEEIDGVAYIAMEFVEGETLSARIRRGPIPFGELIGLCIQIADALDAAHSVKVIHRDIKPANVKITPRGQAKVLDFGLARIDQAAADSAEQLTRTMPGSIMGTAHYMSPEQALGQDVDHRTDIFSFGAMLYQMISGRLPFDGQNFAQILVNVTRSEPAPLHPSTPADLAAIVRRCLEKQREKRYQNCAELVLALREMEKPEGTRTRSFFDVPAPAAPVSGRRKLLWVFCGSALLGAGGYGGYRYVTRGPVYDSVAILPFTNASGTADTDYLSDGLTEGLINSVSRVRGVTVVARSAVFRYKGKETDPQAVAKQLNVKAVVTGRVTGRDGKLQVSAELIDGRTSRHIWGEQYNREALDLLSLQETLSGEIARQLSRGLSGEEAAAVTKRYTQDKEAFQHYLKGRYFLNRRTGESLVTAISWFQQAVDKDPVFALAWSGLADAYALQVGVQPAESYQRAKAAAKRALEIDGALAEPRTNLALVAMHYEWDWKGAEAQLQQAIQINPSLPPGHSLYGRLLASQGRYEESAAEMKRALDLDPLALGPSTGLGLTYYLARDYDRSIAQYRKTLQTDPRFALAWMNLAAALAQKRQYKEAVEAHEKALELSPNDAGALGEYAWTLGASGKRDAGRQVIGRMDRLASQRYVPPYFYALAHAGLDDRDRAFEYLEKAIADRNGSLIFARVEPRLDPLRKDPRFAKALRSLGLEGAAK